MTKIKYEDFKEYAKNVGLRAYEVVDDLNSYGSYALYIHNELDVNEFYTITEYPQDEVADSILEYLEDNGYVEIQDDDCNILIVSEEEYINKESEV